MRPRLFKEHYKSEMVERLVNVMLNSHNADIISLSEFIIDDIFDFIEKKKYRTTCYVARRPGDEAEFHKYCTITNEMCKHPEHKTCDDCEYFNV